MRRFPRCALLLALVLAAAPRPAQGQAPGYPPVDNRKVFAEFHAEVLSSLNELMADWGQAWADDDVAELADLYWENAILIPPVEGAPLRGEDQIRRWFGNTLPELGGMEAFMLDFDASGGMAVVNGNYQLQGAGNANALASGPMVTVYLLRGRTWKIRSQVFTPGS